MARWTGELSTTAAPARGAREAMDSRPAPPIDSSPPPDDGAETAESACVAFSTVPTERRACSMTCCLVGMNHRPSWTINAAMRSASAAMVFEGFRPSAFGTMAPSATYRFAIPEHFTSVFTTPSAAVRTHVGAAQWMRRDQVVRQRPRERAIAAPPVASASCSCVRTMASIVAADFCTSQSRNSRLFSNRQDAVGGVAPLREPRHDVVDKIVAWRGGWSAPVHAPLDQPTGCSPAARTAPREDRASRRPR